MPRVATYGTATLRKKDEMVKRKRGEILSGSKGGISYETCKPVTLFSYLVYSICNLNKEKKLNICAMSLEISRLFPAYPTFFF